ncbi:unnamed protein product [Zymoseptoria tritici ST99CH_3D7]|uniref:Secreted protein n=1 Tax=Zymoseptoria tritici (strain ST99CH_3D7) TaxID=1276538 RepID=A0A1X7RMA3_ZYMT9|nr:unnamed protein product [Zymoseptoria tritici ST99CH_3D7]
MQLCASLLLVQLPASSRSTQPFQHALLLFIQTVSIFPSAFSNPNLSYPDQRFDHLPLSHLHPGTPARAKAWINSQFFLGLSTTTRRSIDCVHPSIRPFFGLDFITCHSSTPPTSCRISSSSAFFTAASRIAHFFLLPPHIHL